MNICILYLNYSKKRNNTKFKMIDANNDMRCSSNNDQCSYCILNSLIAMCSVTDPEHLLGIDQRKIIGTTSGVDTIYTMYDECMSMWREHNEHHLQFLHSKNYIAVIAELKYKKFRDESVPKASKHSPEVRAWLGESKPTRPVWDAKFNPDWLDEPLPNLGQTISGDHHQGSPAPLHKRRRSRVTIIRTHPAL